MIRQLQACGRLAGLAVYGSPYLWQTLRPLLPSDLPAAYSPGQMPQAQAVLLERFGLAAAALEHSAAAHTAVHTRGAGQATPGAVATALQLHTISSPNSNGSTTNATLAY